MSLPSISFDSLLPFAAFGLIFALAFLIVERIWGRKYRAEERLDQIRRRKSGDAAQSEAARATSSKVTSFLAKATPQLASPLQPKTQVDAGKLRQRLSHAGFRSDNAVTIYLGIKTLCFLLGLSVGGGFVAFSYGLTVSFVLRSVIVGLVMFFVPDVIVWLLYRRRRQAVFLGLPDAIDLMVISVEAGLGLDQAMRKVAEEMVKSHRVIAHEFGLANMQLQMGMSRVQVLRELGERNGEEDLQVLASVLVQASKFGSGVGQALRVQSNTMRVRRRQIAEEKAAKCSVKLIFPLVLFIFPGIFVVLVGPAAIAIARNLLTLSP